MRHDRHSVPPPVPDDLTPSTDGHWTRPRVFVVAWVTYSAYKIVHLLVLLAAQPAPPSAAMRVGMGLLDGAMVGMGTLLLIAAGERFPVEKPYRARNVSVHVLLGFACSVTTLSMLYAVGRLLHPAELPESLFVFNLLSIAPSLFVFLSISAIVQAVEYQRRYRTREVDALRLRAQLTAARLESLRAKLHPHFLFNTLNGISDLIFTDPVKADALVLRLAQLLRAALDTVDDEIPVRQELEMLSAYFDIERMRFGDRLRVTIDADQAASDARVPPFLVQPLAENAIQHGIAPRVSGGAVTLRARVRHDEPVGTLVLELTDDGVGMADNAREGIGLRITRQRLQTLYRGAGALSVVPRPGGGTIATIELPFATATR